MIRRISLLLLLILFSWVSYAQESGRSSSESHRSKEPNALINESSRYLLQHAYNPVDWQPWTPEVLARARRENKLLIISIGYASCHWCHVMEEETFSNEEVAEIMNRDFISIKVDREERPDLDQFYMTAVQLMTGSGGWPLNIIALPDGRPVYGGTYHPRDRWTNILDQISKRYQSNPETVIAFADRLESGIKENPLVAAPAPDRIIDTLRLRAALGNWKKSWDFTAGGNKGEEKFPLVPERIAQLEFATLLGDTDAQQHLSTTLDRILTGGLYDAIGGGVFRYSTDSEWNVPHFEKMLYDQVQMISLLCQASRAATDETQREFYKWYAGNIIGFLTVDMQFDGILFYATLDADTPEGEGAYYLWNKEELVQILNNDFKLFEQSFRPFPIAESTKQHWIGKIHSASGNLKEKSSIQSRLLAARKERTAPAIDDKIITSWNALAIRAFVELQRTYDDVEGFLQAAKFAYGFLLKENSTELGLAHSNSTGAAANAVFLEDYAYMALAALDLFSMSSDPKYLEDALKYVAQADALFLDTASGFYRNSAESGPGGLIVLNDGVLPNANAAMAEVLLLLGLIQQDPDFIERSKAMTLAVLPNWEQDPGSYPSWGRLLLKHGLPFYEMAIVGSQAGEVQKQLSGEYLPNVFIGWSTGESEIPMFQYRYVADETTIYVCREFLCKQPVVKVSEALKQVRGGW